MEQIFIYLAIILSTAFIVSSITRILNQPIIIGYIIAGILISPFVIELGTSQEVIHIFSEIGIAFLLFIVGLHLNPKVIKEIGSTSFFIGIGQVIITFAISFLITNKILAFALIPSLYISIAISLSSTIIAMKILSDKKQLDSLHGKIATGILIMQDLVAIGVLIFISSITNGDSITTLAVKGLLGGSVLITTLFLFGFFFLPKITRQIAKSQELLFLFSISWCFLIAAIFTYVGFSIEIGALIAGVTLSISPYSTEISAKIRPLRDFFLIIFFIILGLKIQISNINTIMLNSLIIAGIALILKPLIISTLTAMFGYTKRTNFLVGNSLGQISEFSLIILTLGLSMNHISAEILSTVTLAGIITITLSSYMMTFNHKLYPKISRIIFEKKKVKEKPKIKSDYNAILFGYNRIGFGILESLKKIKKKYLVVDFNPETINDLKKQKIPSLYGDIHDLDFLEELPLEKIKIAISTVPDYSINIMLLNTIKAINPNAIVILRAHQIEEAIGLYKKGASYVLTPHFLGGEYISKMLKEIRTNGKKYKKEKEKHEKMLKEMYKKGHKHPEIEKN